MKLRNSILILAMAAGACAAETASPTSMPASNLASWDSYKLLLTRNIFLRDRTAYQPGERRMEPATRGDSPIVLTGTIVQGNDRTAFFEDTGSGRTLRVFEGQNVANAKLTSISIDRVELSSGGAMRAIQVGQTLAGANYEASTAPPAASTAASSQPSSSASGQPQPTQAQPSSGAPASANDLLERMRQRRLQELK